MNGCMNVEESSRVVILCIIPDICLERLRETTRKFSQDCRCFSRDSNWAPPEDVSEEIPLYSLAWYCSFITSATFRLSVTHIASVDW